MKKGDYVLIVFLVIISVFFLFQIENYSPTGSKKYVSIKIDGVEEKRLEFSSENVGKTFLIESKYGKNVLEMEADRVHMIEASCPDKLDIKQGYISSPGEMLVCLPNHLIVEIIEKGSQEIDAIGR